MHMGTIIITIIAQGKVHEHINRLTIGHGDRYCMKTSVKKIGLAKQLFNHPLICWLYGIVALG